MRSFQIKTVALSFSAMVLSLVMSQTSFAGPKEVKGKSEVAREVKASTAKAQEITVSKISQRVELPVPVVSEFVMKETQESPVSENSRALMDLLNRSSVEGKRNVTQMEVENAETTAVTLNAIIRLKKASEGEFHLRLSDLVEINKSWSAEQKANFNSVLSRASEISELALKEGKKITPDEAFIKALEEAGLLQKYNEGCR